MPAVHAASLIVTVLLIGGAVGVARCAPSPSAACSAPLVRDELAADPRDQLTPKPREATQPGRPAWRARLHGTGDLEIIWSNTSKDAITIAVPRDRAYAPFLKGIIDVEAYDPSERQLVPKQTWSCGSAFLAARRMQQIRLAPGQSVSRRLGLPDAFYVAGQQASDHDLLEGLIGRKGDLRRKAARPVRELTLRVTQDGRPRRAIAVTWSPAGFETRPARGATGSP